MSNEVRAPGVYLDSNVFIYLIEGDADLLKPVERLLRTFADRAAILITSELTLAEVLAPSASRPFSADRRQDYISAMVGNPSVRLIPITRDILLGTVEIRRAANHKLPDAIHCATAVAEGCQYLMSHDRLMRRLPAGIIGLDVDDSGVDTIIQASHA